VLWLHVSGVEESCMERHGDKVGNSELRVNGRNARLPKQRGDSRGWGRTEEFIGQPKQLQPAQLGRSRRTVPQQLTLNLGSQMAGAGGRANNKSQAPDCPDQLLWPYRTDDPGCNRPRRRTSNLIRRYVRVPFRDGKPSHAWNC
jgi:hypothetical protein